MRERLIERLRAHKWRRGFSDPMFEQGHQSEHDLANEAADALATLEARVKQLESMVYVPGWWRCAKCNFRLCHSNLNMRDGSVTPNNDPGETCPNCNSPLWRISEREDRQDAQRMANQLFEEKSALQSQLEELTTQARVLKDGLDALPTDPKAAT